MNSEMTRQFWSLGLSILLSILIMIHYRRKAVSPIFRYLTFGPRFWTGVIDALIMWPVGFITMFLFTRNVPGIVAAILVIVQNLTWQLYTVLMHAHNGQTVGKMVTKVRVVDFRTEGKISMKQAWLREGIPIVLSVCFVGYEVYLILTGSYSPTAIANGEAMSASRPFWILAALPLLWFLAEVLTMLTNKKRRALHDFIAGTVVIRTNIKDGGGLPPAGDDSSEAKP